MAKKERVESRRRIVAFFCTLAGIVLVGGIWILKSGTEPAVTLASQDKKADANQRPADVNQEGGQKGGRVKKPARPDHNHPAFTERVDERKRMVATQIRARDVKDPNVLKAMRIVPRHAFVPRSQQQSAYMDFPLPIEHNQTISQPYIVAFMTDALKLRSGSKVLEIGTGSGYQAAVCAEIAREVYTIEIVEGLAKSAKERLKKLGYKNVFVKAGDGFFGWPEKAPFDAIIGTAAAKRIPEPLLEQLKPGGRMIIPTGSPYGFQYLELVAKDKDGKIRKSRVMPVSYTHLTLPTTPYV